MNFIQLWIRKERNYSWQYQATTQQLDISFDLNKELIYWAKLNCKCSTLYISTFQYS